MSRPSAKSAARPVPSAAAPVREQIVTAALVLLDREGMEEFSTRKLGAEVGMRAMSLYHHFPDRAAILDASVDRMLGELALPNVARIGWRRGLRELALSYREMGHRHMLAIPLLAQRCPSSPNMTAFLDTLLALLLKSGLPQGAATMWLFILRDYVVGSLVADHSVYMLARELPAASLGQGRFFLAPEARQKAFNRGFEAMMDAIEAE